MTLSDFVSRLQGVRKQGGGYVARCPAHDDSKPSMSVSAGTDGRILFHCHAGCTAEAIVGAMGLKMADVMPERKAEPPPPKAQPRRVVATYDYEDSEGRKVYRVTRYEPKDFRQAQWRDGRLVANMDGVRRVPYRLPKVIAAARAGQAIFVAEGEKDVESLERFGAVATCNAGGAGKWDAAWAEYFKGARQVFVIADNDTAAKKRTGQRHAVAVRDSLRAVGIDAVAFVMPEGCKDFTEWAEAKKRTRKELRDYAHNPQPWPREWEFNLPPETETGVIERLGFAVETYTFADVPDYVPEEQDPNILVKGRWLERGGSAFIVSTAGTGKSIGAEQLALCFSEGRGALGLVPLRPLRIWIYQTEDSMSRLAIDRPDITAELMEKMSDVDWRATWGKVRFVKYPGAVGVDFLERMDEHLSAEPPDGKPDVVIFNPFFAFIGGAITDSAYVTPFLRGGEINLKATKGLQFILEKHKCGLLAFHHTPKPPTEKELDGWMKATFPEYQGAGSADITNWGRSFITMMRVKGREGMVCLTAGKNGADLGWDSLDGARRHYMAWSRAKGVTGGNRHAWRELDEDELAEVTKQARDTLTEDVERIVSMLKDEPMTRDMIATKHGMTQRRFNAAWGMIKANYLMYGLAVREIVTGKGKPVFFGLPDMVERYAKAACQNWHNCQQSAHENGNQLTNFHQLSPTFRKSVNQLSQQGDKYIYTCPRESRLNEDENRPENGNQLSPTETTPDDIDPLTEQEVLI